MPGVSIPIIDQLAHPSTGLLTRALEGVHGPGPLSFTLTPPQNPLVALTYGLTWSIFTAPIQWGKIIGNPDEYTPGFIQVTSVYTDLSGHDVFKQSERSGFDGGMYFWNEPLPTSILIHIQPGFTLTLQWEQT